jgi:hypothetical protein
MYSYLRECSWPAQSGWRILRFATAVCRIHIDALGYLSPSHCNDLCTGRHLLGVSFIISPKKNVCTTLIIQITRRNNCIISHAQNTPAFQPNHIFDWNTSVTSHKQETVIFHHRKKKKTAKINCRLLSQYQQVLLNRGHVKWHLLLLTLAAVKYLTL